MHRRTPDLRRSLLFVAGAEGDAQARALEAYPDVIIQDLEDSTPNQLKEAGGNVPQDCMQRLAGAGSWLQCESIRWRLTG